MWRSGPRAQIRPAFWGSAFSLRGRLLWPERLIHRLAACLWKKEQANQTRDDARDRDDGHREVEVSAVADLCDPRRAHGGAAAKQGGKRHEALPGLGREELQAFEREGSEPEGGWLM